MSVRASHKSLRRSYETFWLDMLSGLQRRGETCVGTDLRRTVFFLFGAMNWTTEWYDEKRSALPALAAELADLVANGLRPKPAARARRPAAKQGKA